MKYFVISIAIAIIVYVGIFLLARVIIKKEENYRKIKIAIITILGGTAFFVVAGLLYLGNYYHADEKAKLAIQGNDKVSVSKIDEGYFFDGPSTDKACVFYPGAKVECEAYAPLMLKLSEEECDCFLVDMPLNLPIFGGSKADGIIESYNYNNWLMMGHSMGGSLAANYANKHSDLLDGVVLLASYAITKLSDEMKVCSIYGSEDKCLELDVYNNKKDNLPGSYGELVIEGGNHSQFGNYGHQDGDGTATISAEEQQKITVKTISELFEK